MSGANRSVQCVVTDATYVTKSRVWLVAPTGEHNNHSGGGGNPPCEQHRWAYRTHFLTGSLSRASNAPDMFFFFFDISSLCHLFIISSANFVQSIRFYRF